MFKSFRDAVLAQFNKMSESQFLFTTAVDKETVWQIYLEAYPEEIRQEYNCNACKSFLRQYSGIVQIDSGYNLVSIWDNIDVEERFAVVAEKLSAYVKSLPISNIFKASTKWFNTNLGTQFNYDEDGKIWNHFYLKPPSRFVFTPNNRTSIDSHLAQYKANKEILEGSLNKFDIAVCDQTLELIKLRRVDRGEQYVLIIKSFKVILQNYIKINNTRKKELFIWLTSTTTSSSVASVKNSAIGTLMVDLIEGVKTVEQALSSYNNKVSAQNYQRTSSIVSTSSIERAKLLLSE